jgi:two-component system response regulator (stage 0 sporulation protein A)
MDRQKSVAIRKTLDQIGVKHSLKGYRYIISAIEKALDDRNKLNRITKTLYIEISQENNDTPSRVERAIRHAIEVTWTDGNPVAINKIFGYTVSAAKGKPTNSEFIALLTDFIDFNYKEIADGTYEFE